MIRVTRLTKSFLMKGGRRRVLRDLSFEVPSGSNLAIIGGEASGKSTLVNLIGGVDYPDRGKIRRAGTISWPFGQMRYERSMTLSQNLRFLCRVQGVRDFDDIQQQVHELTGFEREFGNPVEMLRQPEQRLLNVALSLSFSFDIMLLDGKPSFNNLPNKERFEEKMAEKMSQSSIILATGKPKEIGREYAYILVLDGQSGRLYDNRRDAIQAFKASVDNRPVTVDNNQSKTVDTPPVTEGGNVRGIRN
ncbi:ATP-binding cassette domain-containing protein [Kordiimonas aestuarii]|uniref:ATP-binding cassette domain-containing protein n=1 Tax=Kordiimonas aestuarii TaxID=1005925 RepID=UPI0021D34797|nr:ATP-binding cassette domain-containing protein [Kordiimonas aestuarii]